MTILINWISNNKRKLEKGAVTLIEKPGTKDVTVLKKRIKDLKKALEKANGLIYGLNFMIDYAEKENKIEIRKSVVPNNKANQRKSCNKDVGGATL
ncbi:hypothetical protein BWD42_12965 [Sphingobacterium sp. CZ-UAM]|uniref:hypothetical protein n=1 Tax=Sphingobacterium sp. CZ-UAM TaxID=1933868 RepID=UPI0009874264|nr:hypothetical protein [Sphingobacterium sp. CZ-UAM]OOG18172.1 hypothetical protein BWD42_12965 [Sphingobacterium sp. CZ-UAM]